MASRIFLSILAIIVYKIISNAQDHEYLYYNADVAPYRFDSMDDINAKQYFNQNGYIVIKNIFADQQESKYSNELLWKYLNSVGWDKSNPSTWNNFPGWSVSGIIYQHGIGQTELQWFIRTRPKLLDTFASLWNLTSTDSYKNLITSYDGIGIFRPWKFNKKWATLDLEWYHIDQNIVNRPSLDAIQGLVALTDQTNLTGSTVVIGKSHLYTNSYLKDMMKKQDSDFQVLREEKVEGLFKEPYNLKPLMIAMKRGDLLLWESRLAHCNMPSMELLKKESDDNDDESCDAKVELLRVVSYVCMTPKNKASENVLKQRIEGFERGLSSNHNPHRPNLYQIPTPKKPNYGLNKNLDTNVIRKLVGY